MINIEIYGLDSSEAQSFSTQINLALKKIKPPTECFITTVPNSKRWSIDHSSYRPLVRIIYQLPLVQKDTPLITLVNPIIEIIQGVRKIDVEVVACAYITAKK